MYFHGSCIFLLRRTASLLRSFLMCWVTIDWVSLSCHRNREMNSLWSEMDSELLCLLINFLVTVLTVLTNGYLQNEKEWCRARWTALNPSLLLPFGHSWPVPRTCLVRPPNSELPTESGWSPWSGAPGWDYSEVLERVKEAKALGSKRQGHVCEKVCPVCSKLDPVNITFPSSNIPGIATTPEEGKAHDVKAFLDFPP